ncbi:MAG TPA: shikimate kinase [Actinomycetes bacterium]|nr:shikimate kinase [Actinomycetes bacterium]
MTGDRSARRAGTRVLLLGMMGAGKTSVGEEIAARTGWAYRDNDSLVGELAGLPTAELLERDGVDALRDTESAALRRAVDDPGPLVAGVAGGVVEREADVELLRRTDALVVYLHAPLDVLVERVGDGGGRPFLQPDPATALRRLFDGREPLYRQVADLVVDTSQGTPADHASQVLAAVPA